MFGIQAADMISSLTRLESQKKFMGIGYDYGSLFEKLSKAPEPYENMRHGEINFYDKPQLLQLSDEIKNRKKR